MPRWMNKLNSFCLITPLLVQPLPLPSHVFEYDNNGNRKAIIDAELRRTDYVMLPFKQGKN